MKLSVKDFAAQLGVVVVGVVIGMFIAKKMKI